MNALPNLRHLSFGEEWANLTVNDNGQPDLTWPWTGRMEQYMYILVRTMVVEMFPLVHMCVMYLQRAQYWLGLW